ncbi:BTB/POZ domain-containing protein [Tieghemostelium lacteum]|uniref:BTB/POZ domain-containing protein n=1 Tax=Tieghemostelium lacteum TaxID=361077 RepID=A0A151ZH28_TIELA|nr:BTB/POZ domain-containing protein [Tieghemostelium lacteum]|eukprot:KYQ93288.1 BTB/POZ domain-containing protein [Tieghemostelium lacteum]
MITEYFKGGFKDYINNQKFSDVKLIYGEKEYHTHRIILAYSSEFFARLLLSEFRESSQTIIELKQPDPCNVFPQVLDFMYDGKIMVSPENVIPLLAMADHYLINDLQSLCTKYLDNNLHRENVLIILKFSIEFHFEQYIEKSITILAKNFPFVCQTLGCGNSGGTSRSSTQISESFDSNTSSTEDNNGSSVNNGNRGSNEIDESLINGEDSYNSQQEEEICDFSFLPPNIFYQLLKHPYLVVKDEYSLYKIVVYFINYYLDLVHQEDPTMSLNNIPITDQTIMYNIKVSDLMGEIRFIWMTYEQLIQISDDPLIPKEILIETFLERLKKFELQSSSTTSSPTTVTQHSPNTLQINTSANHSSKTRYLPRPPESILFEYTSDFDNKGILYWIATNGNPKDTWVNPHQSQRIKVTSSSIDKGSHHGIVDLSPQEFWTKDVPASWVMIDMGVNRSVIPHYYTIRHGLSYKSDSLRTWDFQGSLNGEQWTVLKRHTSDMSLNSKYATFTWNVSGVETAFRYFRILQTGKNSNNRNFLVIGGLEIYGELLQL